MKITNKIFLTLLLCCFVSCASNNVTNSKEKSEDPFPSYSYNENAIGTNLSCPIKGKVTSVETKDNLTNLIISCQDDYFWEGQIKTCEYEFLIFNIENYTNVKELSVNLIIGNISADTKLTARNKNLDPYMVRLSNSPATLYKNYYYFLPAWIMQDRTNFLNYRQIDNFDDQVCDFYNRWASEVDEVTDADNVQNNIVSLFNYPNLDSVRFKTKLDKYPSEINRSAATGFTEKSYFGRNIFVFETPFESECAYTPVLYWQNGFDQYLKDEYKLGTDIYIYCTFLALDHQNKKIIINVRDFSMISDEEIVSGRIDEILGKE